jgi:Zn-dependent peptidase ImmA (M78 family)
MLLTSGKSPHSSLTFRVYDFFSTLYNEVHNTLIEVYHTDLSDDNAFGFTEVNGDEQLISLHDNLNETDYVITLLHELVHVVQNLRGELNDDQRENEAYSLENELYSKFQVIKVRIV